MLWLLLILSSVAASLAPGSVLNLCQDQTAYRIEEIIGEGSFGTVYLATDINTNDLVAIKVVEETENEMKMIALTSGHENVVEYICGEMGYIVMEYCPDGSLTDLILRGDLDESKIRLIFSQLASGLKHLYKHRVIHRDLKPDNILLSTDTNGEMVIKIADFGLATRLLEGRKKHGTPGSMLYMAPERLTSKYDFKSELWSIGIISYKMLTGNVRFSGKTSSELYNNMKPFSEERKKTKVPETVSRDLRILVEDLLVFQPSSRLTMESFFKRAARLRPGLGSITCFFFC